MATKNVHVFELKLGKRALILFILGMSCLLFVVFLFGVTVGKNIDVYVTPTMDDNDLGLTNLTGHPQVVVPDGFSNGLPTSISFVGQLFGEAGLLAVAKAYQDATPFHLQHPKLAE